MRTYTRTRVSGTYNRGRGKKGGGGGGYVPTTPDTTPAAFTFTNVTEAELSTVTQTPNTVTLSGTDAASPITVSSGLEYSTDLGVTWTSLAGTVTPGGTVDLQATSSSQYSTTLSFTVNIGGVEATWTIRTKAEPAAPPEDAILFGVGTRCGYGGAPGPWAEGATIASGTGFADWTINADGLLVPSGTYGALKTFSKAAGESYDLTLSDATEITITLVADDAHCAATSADTSASFQLKTYLQTAGLDYDIVGRDGWLNPTSATGWRFTPPAAGYARAITVRSENPTSGNDAYGNALRGGGFRIGSLLCGGTSLAVIPLTFEDVTFYNETNDSVHGAFLAYASSAGRGVGFTRCRGENAQTVDIANIKDGFTLRGATGYRCAFARVRKGFNGGLEDGAAQTRIAECTCREATNDFAQLIGQNYLIEDNFCYDFLTLTGAHPDGAQNYGVNPITYTLPMIHRRNIWVMNTGAWFQGDFISDKPSPYWLANNVTIENEIILTGLRAVTVTRGQGATVSNCLGIRMPGLAASIGSSFIDISTCESSVVDSCVANSFSVGANTSSDNVVLAATIAATQTAFPNFPTNVAAPGFTTRAAVITACTPANLAIASGGVKKLDGTYAGPLNAAGAYQ